MSEKEKDQEKKKPQAKQAGGGPQKGGAKGEKKARKPKEAAGPGEVATEEDLRAPHPTPRLLERYKAEIAPALKQKFGMKNMLAVPRLEKIVLSMGLGRFATEGGDGKARFNQAEKELSIVAGQKPLRCRAKKSVSNFKLREGMEVGLKVTLRGQRMYEFLDRLITLAIPRVKDFRGLNPAGFDKRGNYNFGFNEQSVFPEVNAAEITFQQGMNITMCTTARDQDQGRELLKQFGMPFRDTAKVE